MKRKVIDDLIKWKNNTTGKPILLTGAKGVGKTYLAYDFAKAFFEQISYTNMERNPAYPELFLKLRSDHDFESFLDHLHIDKDTPSENRLLILDELGLCPHYMEILQILYGSGIFSHILCITSNPISSEDYIYFDQVPVHSLEFDEFLLATANEWYIEAITNHYENDKKIPEIVHKELLALHQLYLQIGGMPGVVNEYLNLSSVINIPEQHNLILGSYHDYILSGISESDALKMNQVIDSIPHQLSKENKKFQYKLIRKGTTHAMYKEAISNLVSRDYIIKCNKITSEKLEELPKLYASEEWTRNEANFKLYLPDTGILSTMMAEEKINTQESDGYKALLENYVAQALHNKGYQFGFWESESMAKVDFIVMKDSHLLPIEIYTSDNTRSKSISVLKQKCDFPYTIKISSKNFENTNQIKYVPYYAVFCI